jgi:hypothetical protein
LEAQRRNLEEIKERNKSEFGTEGEASRQLHEGFRSGLYVRILLKGVPVEFLKVETNLLLISFFFMKGFSEPYTIYL